MRSKKSATGAFRILFTSTSFDSVDPERVSLGQVESRLRSVAPNVQERLDISNVNALTPVVAGGVALLSAIYLLGRRRGKKRATILEIRRS